VVEMSGTVYVEGETEDEKLSERENYVERHFWKPLVPNLNSEPFCGPESETQITNKQVHYRTLHSSILTSYIQRPIQLLRPPGLCKHVCPILTTPISALLNSSHGSQLPDFSNSDCVSIASISGLGVAIGVDADAKNDPRAFVVDATSSEVFDGKGVLNTGIKDSAYHSYHTCRWLVRRQIYTCNSELLGKYNGACIVR